MCFQVLIMHQIRWRPGLCPGPRWGSLRRSPMPLSWIGRGHRPVDTPSHYPSPLDAIGVSLSVFGSLAPQLPRIAPVLEMETRRLCVHDIGIGHVLIL